MNFDLDEYLARIGFTGAREASAETLAAVHAQHVRTIPFENLDVLLGRGIRIDLASIQQKLVRDRRGGYCFEQNHLLAAALTALGFNVTPLIGRVRWQVPPEVQTGLTHMVLQVVADGRSFIADVGFGSMSLVVPLSLELDVEQPASLEPRRLIRRERLLIHQARLGEAWADVYQFSLDAAPPIDFELGNWFTATHPQSRFRQNLVAARVAEGCRYALLNREFTIRYPGGRAESRTVQTPDELLDVLAEFFSLSFPPNTRFGTPESPWPR